MNKDTLQIAEADGTANLLSVLSRMGAAAANALGNGMRKIKIRRKVHALRLEETLQLGEKRFLAVVEWQNQILLLGVTPQAVSLLEKRTKESSMEQLAVESASE